MSVNSRESTRASIPIEQMLYPIKAFMHAEASGGIVLILAALTALVWANSPWAGAYTSLWETKITIGPAAFQLSETLLHWVNDGLMAIFFFVVGLEIKREVLVGELASPRQAALPAAAALGGMLAPALIFVAITAGGEGSNGWGVPMATDIAFALGVLALLGRRVPESLRVFLTALAIVDDLGAVLVIALFYTSHIVWAGLGAAAIFLLALIVLNRLGADQPLIYAVLGVGVWVALLESGVHASVAGVLVALTIPARNYMDSSEFYRRAHDVLHRFDRAGESGTHILSNAGQQSALGELEELARRVQSPLQRMEHALHPWVAFAIVPVFALANAGVKLEGGAGIVHPVTIGILVGLVVGKQLGVTGACWLAARSKLARLPEGITWGHIYGASWLAGIGFTMSLFIGALGFGEGPLLNSAKVGILGASLVAGGGGWLLLWGVSRRSS